VAHVSAVRTDPAAVAAGAPAASRSAPPALRRSDAVVPLRRLGARLSQEWLPRIAWSVGRTGRPGLVGIGLLAASAVFLVSTHLKMVDEVRTLEADLASARARAAAAPAGGGGAAAPSVLDSLPARTEMPSVLGVLLLQADNAHLTLETGKYEISSTKSGDVTRYKLSFPVTGPYPQVRQFIDSTLKELPAVAISDLSFERKAIGDAKVEAQIRMTVFTRGGP
jgi:hypothetical protein